MLSVLLLILSASTATLVTLPLSLALAALPSLCALNIRVSTRVVAPAPSLRLRINVSALRVSLRSYQLAKGSIVALDVSIIHEGTTVSQRTSTITTEAVGVNDGSQQHTLSLQIVPKKFTDELGYL